MQPALLYKPLDNHGVQCHLCQRRCTIASGKSGYCGTRRNLGGKLFSSTYGRVSSMRISPIEIKPLFHFYPGSQWLSMGSLGCNFLCSGCQNWEIAHADVDKELPSLRFITPEESVQLARDGHCKGISWTYNEPTLWFEYTLDSARRAREAGLLTNYVTNAYLTIDALDLIGPYLDAFRADLKGFSNETYKHIANIKGFERILKILERAKHFWGMHVEIVTNIVPAVNDGKKELREMAEWIFDRLGSETPWHVTRFVPHFKLSHLAPTAVASLEEAREMGLEAGLKYVYLGNVPGHPAENTYCPACGKLLIERANYRIIQYHLNENCCGYCGRPIAGHFESSSHSDRAPKMTSRERSNNHGGQAMRTKTGVFFHPSFSGAEWIIIGDKFRRFPGVMEHALKNTWVRWFVPEKVQEEILLKIHTPRFVENLKKAWYCEGALYSVGGCVEATEKILSSEIENALVFTVAAGHHAERDSAWGGTYASCAGPSIYHARQKFGRKRFAILDTDSHHGNGTRSIFLQDDDVLHVCFCDFNRIEGDGTKICVDTGWRCSDESYMAAVRKEFMARAVDFRPDMILHNLGHDTCVGDYGDRGLTEDFFPRLAAEVKACAQSVCSGKYLVLTHGGSRTDVAEYIFPRIIEILAGQE